MVINTNIPSAYAARVLSVSTNSLSKALARLSSGSRIVSPEDDAAGLAQSMKFGTETRRIVAARSNVGNAISFSQTQDGFMSKINSALRRMSELATLSADQTKSATDVANYQKEFSELKLFITKSATKTFNGVGLFSAAGLQDKELGTNDAIIKQMYDDLATKYNDWLTDPADVANSGNVALSGSGLKATGVFNHNTHNFESGMEINLVSWTGAAPGTGNISLDFSSKYYVKVLTAHHFELYTDKAFTAVNQVKNWGGADMTAITLNKSGEYSKLRAVRDSMAQMAGE